MRSPPVLRSVGISSMSTGEEEEKAGGEPWALLSGLSGGGESLKRFPWTAAAAATAAAWNWPCVSARWWKLVWNALGDGGGGIMELLSELLPAKLLMLKVLQLLKDGDEGGLPPLLLPFEAWSAFEVSEAGGGCWRSREMFLMFFSSVGFRRNLEGE